MTDLLTTREVKELLKLDRTTIYRMLKQGRLSGVRVGQQWRFTRQAVEALLRGEHAGEPAPVPEQPAAAPDRDQQLLPALRAGAVARGRPGTVRRLVAGAGAAQRALPAGRGLPRRAGLHARPHRGRRPAGGAARRRAVPAERGADRGRAAGARLRPGPRGGRRGGARGAVRRRRRARADRRVPAEGRQDVRGDRSRALAEGLGAGLCPAPKPPPPQAGCR